MLVYGARTSSLSAATTPTPARVRTASAAATSAQDRVSLSEAGRAALAGADDPVRAASAVAPVAPGVPASLTEAEVEAALPGEPTAPETEGDDAAPLGAETDAAGAALNTDEQQVVREMQARDREVRAHEAAHQAAGGGLVGGASFSYQVGPDGRAYAVGGEVGVSVDTSGTPQERIANARRVRAAALAAPDPSAQDLSVAAAASALEAAAQRELAVAAAEAAAVPRPAARAVSAYQGANRSDQRSFGLVA